MSSNRRDKFSKFCTLKKCRFRDGFILGRCMCVGLGYFTFDKIDILK